MIDGKDPSTGFRDKINKMSSLHGLEPFNVPTHTLAAHLGDRVPTGSACGPAALQSHFGGLVEAGAGGRPFGEVVLGVDYHLARAKDHEMVEDGVQVQAGEVDGAEEANLADAALSNCQVCDSGQLAVGHALEGGEGGDHVVVAIMLSLTACFFSCSRSIARFLDIGRWRTGQ